MKKNGKYTEKKKTNGHTWKSPFSAPCPGLFPATLSSSLLSFLLQFKPPSLSLKILKKTKKTPPFPTMLSSPSPFLVLSFFFLSLYLGFAFPTISAAAAFSATFFLSRLPATAFSAIFSVTTFSVSLLLQLQNPYGH